MTCFEPSAARGLECRRAMDAALWSSVRGLLAQSLAEETSTGVARAVADDTIPTHPLDYGAYFDLVLTPPGAGDLPEAVTDLSAGHLLERLTRPGAAPPDGAREGLPRITNLAEAAYTPTEIERFRRWWDIEPENAMGLTGVTDAEFDIARRGIVTAFDRLRDAAPELHGEILATISDIVITRPDGSHKMDFGAVSSFSLWGGFAINVAEHAGWPHYYRTLVHEAGHNLLFGIARDGPLVEDAPEERFFSPLREQLRPMDGIYHAAFVSARESLAFDRLLCRHEARACLAEDEVAALSVLLEASVIAFWECAEEVRQNAHLTPLGQAILEECEAYMRASFAVEPA